MSIVFFGTPRFSVPPLKALIESGEMIDAVVTRMDKARGRGHRLIPSAVKEFALDGGLRLLQPGSMRDEAFVGELSKIRPEFIVVAAYGKILTRAVLDIPKRGAINIHASLLPKFRGASPVARAIIEGEGVTGVTTMLMTEGLDEGDILLREEVEIGEDETAESLSLRLSLAGASLIVRTLKGIRDGTVVPLPQSGEPSFAPPLRKEEGRVEWSRTAREIYNFVRGMYPWPGAFCYINGERVKLLRAAPLKGKAGPLAEQEGPLAGQEGKIGPGVIEKAGEEGISVGTGSGIILILELQPEGKRPMTAGAFVRGRRIKPGALIS